MYMLVDSIAINIADIIIELASPMKKNSFFNVNLYLESTVVVSA